jgi:hypothetical protein
LLREQDLQQIALLDAYGALIANTDRHRHNFLLFAEGPAYTAAPAFDQLPMAYAPPASGHFRNTAVEDAVPTVNTLDVWEQARGIAAVFWRRAQELALSESMRAIVETHARRSRN